MKSLETVCRKKSSRLETRVLRVDLPVPVARAGKSLEDRLLTRKYKSPR